VAYLQRYFTDIYIPLQKEKLCDSKREIFIQPARNTSSFPSQQLTKLVHSSYKQHDLANLFFFLFCLSFLLLCLPRRVQTDSVCLSE
jgi:hypothetical protein